MGTSIIHSPMSPTSLESVKDKNNLDAIVVWPVENFEENRRNIPLFGVKSKIEHPS